MRKTLGNYVLLSKLSSGGMGELYLAQRQRDDLAGPFVIKLVHRRWLKDPAVRAMFEDEVRTASALHHPNIVTTLEIGESEDGLFMVLEYVPGASLATLSQKLSLLGRKFSPAFVVSIGTEIAAGLHAAHTLKNSDGASLDLVHRDVSPQNAIVGLQGQVKLIDFGIAKMRERAQPRTAAGERKGKLAYMAYEQLQGETIDRRTDVFALGVVLWELLTGERFRDTSNRRMIEQVLSGEDERAHHDAIPVELQSVLRRALRRDASSRFDSARDFAGALRAALPAALEVSADDRGAAVLALVGPEVDDQTRRVGRRLQLGWDSEELTSAPARAIKMYTLPVGAAEKRGRRFNYWWLVTGGLVVAAIMAWSLSHSPEPAVAPPPSARKPIVRPLVPAREYDADVQQEDVLLVVPVDEVPPPAVEGVRRPVRTRHLRSAPVDPPESAETRFPLSPALDPFADNL